VKLEKAEQNMDSCSIELLEVISLGFLLPTNVLSNPISSRLPQIRMSLFSAAEQSRPMPHLFIPRYLGSKFKRQLQFEFATIVNRPPYLYNIFYLFFNKKIKLKANNLLGKS
jgi:hypothetical protein